MKYLLVIFGAAGGFAILLLLVDWLDQYFYIKDRPKSIVGKYLYTNVEAPEDYNEVLTRLRDQEQSQLADCGSEEVSNYS